MPGRRSTARRRGTAACPARTRRQRCASTSPTRATRVVAGPDPRRGQIPERAADDFVIARGDGSVLYNFAVAVDDVEMGITDVIRGDDHLSNTPKQLLVMEALGVDAAPLRPSAAAARSRRQEALQAPRRRQRAGAARGRLPAGGRPQLPGAAGLGDRRRHDDHEHRGAGPALRASRTWGRASAIFDEQKLRWLNGRFMRELPLDEYTRGRREAPRPRARRGAAGRVRDRPGQGADA